MQLQVFLWILDEVEATEIDLWVQRTADYQNIIWYLAMKSENLKERVTYSKGRENTK